MYYLDVVVDQKVAEHGVGEGVGEVEEAGQRLDTAALNQSAGVVIMQCWLDVGLKINKYGQKIASQPASDL
jgi:hypothetical protein